MSTQVLRSNIQWWESRRLIFNLAVGVVGSYAIYEGMSGKDYNWSVYDTLGVLWWGIGANIFYSLGLLVEIFDWYYFKNKLGLRNLRLFLFISGLVLSCMWTFWSTLIYFS